MTLEVALLAVVYLLTGLTFVVGAVVLLAGYEWGLFAAGVLLVGLAVFERRGTA